MIHNRISLATAILPIVILGSACSQTAAPQKAPSEAPAKLNGTPVKESELTTITLTPEAEGRLGIRVEEASSGRSTDIHKFAAEIVKPHGSSMVVSSPLAGTLSATSLAPAAIGSFVEQDQVLFTIRPFLPISQDVVVTVEGEVAQARTRVETARQRKARADRMLADEVGTVRAQEEAQYELASATAALQAAENRLNQIKISPLDGTTPVQVRAPQSGILRQVFVTAGQAVSSGTPLFEVENTRDVWVRVPVYAGEVQSLNSKAAISVQTINGTGRTWTAAPVDAPPSADPSSATVHLYYRLPNPDSRFKPGEKLIATIQGNGPRNWIEIPWSAVVFDTHGGTWVYETLGERRYARRRVDVDHSLSGKAYLRAGIAAGTKVVAEGVAELWGFEFGTGK